MNAVEEYLEKHRIGFPTFEKLFNLKKEELLKVLREICIEKKYEDILENSSNVYKYIENDLPTKIRVCSWSSVEITPTGIYYKPEHGDGHSITLFHKFFVLNI